VKCSRFVFSLFFIVFLSINLQAQETNSHASGSVSTSTNEMLAGASVTVIHEPTQSNYVAVTHTDGFFHFFHLKPGGPYRISISSIGYQTLTKTNLYLHLTGDHFSAGDSEASHFVLQEKIATLPEVIIENNNSNRNRNGIETNSTRSALQSLPTISRSLQDFVRLVPQAKVTGDGVMSLAGQNNRFNAFFIDGANNNDIFGLAANGMNGGQTGAPPISIEAIEEINVLLAPYHVQYGNFTGGSINAITRSGSNENKASAWYYFRNEALAGRSPQPLEKPGSPGVLHRPRLSSFFNQTVGGWSSGSLIRNTLFYFALLEKQSEQSPQPFDIREYRGTSNQQQLAALAHFLQSKYHYDPGLFLQTKNALKATRLNLKLDWNASAKNKLMLSYRYNNAVRTAPRVLSSATSVLFQNNGIIVPARTHAASFEWKRFFKKDRNNRLLLTATNQLDDRRWIGQPFPGVSIFDGIGSIVFGSDAVTGVYHFKATDITLFDAFTFIKKAHVVTAGLDVNYSKLNAGNIPDYFGYYYFKNVADFMDGAPPVRLQRSFSLADDPAGNQAHMFETLRGSSFINDEIRLGTNLKVAVGLRLDINKLPSKPAKDTFFDDTAINIISNYYDLGGATSGRLMKAQWVFSPRIGVDYELPKHKITVRGGAGVFSGHIVNVWPFNIFNTGTGSIDISPQQYGLNFIADPYSQPTPQSLNMDASNLKGDLNLMAKNFKYPAVFRASLGAEKRLKKAWTFSIEGILTKNIHEAAFRSVNILPPVGRSASPGSRNIYSLNAAPANIPLRSNGINPYAQVFLLTNNSGKKGSSYSLSLIISKQVDGFSINSSYTYGRSKVLFEITGPTTPIRAQWRNMETANGRNFVALSTSDNDLQHRVTTWMSKRLAFAKEKAATTISLFYNGQSGNPYSYVYNGSMINDNGPRDNFDLIYIPTASDLAAMNFIPNTVGQITYSPQQQKDFLNAFIKNDNYLKKHRGQFSERNGARLPFTHIIDLRLQQDITLKMGRNNVGLTLTYDVFNFTNMLNKAWGRIYFLTNDNFPLIQFAGYSDRMTLTPQYQFTPFHGKPYSLQTSTVPGNSARWISQLGIKMALN
jgi:hypothetical protein